MDLAGAFVRAHTILEPNDIFPVQGRSPVHTNWPVIDWFRQHPEIRLIDWLQKDVIAMQLGNPRAIMVREWEVPEHAEQDIDRRAKVV